MSKNAKPCPFCGSKDISTDHSHDIFCEDCGASRSFSSCTSREEKIEAWNERETGLKRIKALNAMLKSVIFGWEQKVGSERVVNNDAFLLLFLSYMIVTTEELDKLLAEVGE